MSKPPTNNTIDSDGVLRPFEPADWHFRAADGQTSAVARQHDTRGAIIHDDALEREQKERRQAKLRRRFNR